MRRQDSNTPATPPLFITIVSLSGPVMVEHIDLAQLDNKKVDVSGVEVVDARFDKEQAYETTSPNLAGLDLDDPNLDPNAIGDLEEDSPYPEVRSAVANTDDTSIPVGTLRAWFFGLCWAIILPGLNQYVVYPLSKTAF